MLCFAIGVASESELVEPLPEGGRRTVGSGIRDSRCLGPSELAPGVPRPEVRPYVDDSARPDARLARVVVAGLLGDRAKSAELLGAGPPRPLELGPHGTYLVVLGPQHADADLRVRRTDDAAPYPDTSIGDGMLSQRCVPIPGRAVRVADPDGGPSWTMGLGRDCAYLGRVIGDHVATVFHGINWAVLQPVESYHPAAVRPGSGDRPLKLSVSDPRRGVFNQPFEDAGPSRAQIARRTLPGRTLLTGTAGHDVRTVTLRTPRDIRTVRPGPGGLILAVYDGFLYGGEVEAVAHMRDGRTVTQTKRIGYLG